DQVRRAESVHESPYKSARIPNRRCGWRGLAEGNALRTPPIGDPAHSGGDLIERRVPGNLFPAWIGVSLRPPPAQWARQPLRVVDELRRRPSLGADCRARWV